MSIRRTVAVIAAALAVLAVTPTSHAQPTTDVDDAAAGWLARQLVGGDHLEHTGFPDHGTTLDAMFAFTASGAAADSADKVMAWFATPAVTDTYLRFGDPDEAFAGAHAKLALAVQTYGLDPTDFAGVDLIAGLTALQTPSGRFSDKSEYGDYSNNFGQSFAVLALDRWDGAPQAAVDYLAGTQCADGGFPLDLETTPCVSQVDATAMAVQALLAVGRTEVADQGLTWLSDTAQLPDGGFRDRTEEGNANSTGLAAQALRAGGRTEAADKAAAFLTSLRVGCDAAETDRGAIAYDRTGFTRATSQKASAQGVLGLVGVSFADLSADGGTAGAPVLDCPVTTTTTTPPTTSDTTPVETTTTTTSAAVADGGGVELARTGVPVGPALWVGSLLLVAGALALVLARKRHATAGVRK